MDASFKKLVYWMCLIILLNFFGASWLGDRLVGRRAHPNVRQFYRTGFSGFPSVTGASFAETPLTQSRNGSSFLFRIVIALPTMGRLSYLEQSIRSYLKILAADDLIVVFAVKNSASIVDMLLKKFPDDFNSSIVVENGNPLVRHLLRNTCELAAYHNDSLGRVLWRSSIVLEHAWMLYRAAFLRPEFVLVMEEDVLVQTTASAFLQEVQNRLKDSPARIGWNMLHLRGYRRVSLAPTHLGGAFGILINASCPSGILGLSAFLLRYFDDSPVDWLIGLYFSHLGSAFGVSASDLVMHIGETSTKTFADGVNDRQHCKHVRDDPCPTVMLQRGRKCNRPMVWEVPTETAVALWRKHLREGGIAPLDH